jgi:hypothetical protein
MINEAIKKIVVENYHGDEDSLQNTISLIKIAGYSQMDTLKALICELDLPIGEADSIILNSKAWAEEKDDNLRFRHELGENLEE